LRCSPFVSLPDEAPLDRLGLDGSAADGEGEPEDGTDEMQKIWRDTKVRRLGSTVPGVGGASCG